MVRLSPADAFDAYLVTGGLPLILDEWPDGASVSVADPTSAVPVSAERMLAAEFPVEDAMIVPNWDVIGLKATGSHDVVADGVAVPVGRTVSIFGGSRWPADPRAGGTDTVRDGHVLTRCLMDPMVPLRHAMFHNAHRQSCRTLLGIAA